MPKGTVYVGRPTIFGNPFSGPRGVESFRRWLAGEDPGELPAACVSSDFRTNAGAVLDALPSLRGKDLACWCAPGEECHADVLLELANAKPAPAPQLKKNGRRAEVLVIDDPEAAE